MWPIAAAVAPAPISPFSTIAMRMPSLGKSQCTSRADNAPSDNDCVEGGDSCRDAPAKGVLWIEDEGRFRGDKSRAGNIWEELSIPLYQAAFEYAADHAFLPPDLTWSKDAFRIQAGQLCAGSGAAGRAVILFAWAEDEIAAIDVWRRPRTVEFDGSISAPSAPWILLAARACRMAQV